MEKTLSFVEIVSNVLVRCILCPMTWKTLDAAIGHDHESPAGYELYEFEGQWILVDSIGMPIQSEKGFRCGECKKRHHSLKAIKLCCFTAADHKAEQEALYLAEMRNERSFEERGYWDGIAQDAYEARNGVIGFREAWHMESPDTCPCCN